MAQFVADIAGGTVAPYWVTLLGVPGSGKTMLTCDTFNEARKYRDAATANHPQQMGIYNERSRRPYYRMIDEATFAKLLLTDEQYDLPEYLAHEWLIAYDDLGSKRDAKGLLADALMRLANQRLGKWTIWNSNLSLGDIASRIDGRISSRLIRDRNKLITLTAPDYADRARRIKK